MNAPATLGISQGHHPADNRSAIPARAYESGSGHGHDAAPDTLARSWRAQRRLHGKYKTMTARGKPAGVAVTAMARELAGFAWAEMTS